jgi:hypothetical protein
VLFVVLNRSLLWGCRLQFNCVGDSPSAQVPGEEQYGASYYRNECALQEVVQKAFIVDEVGDYPKREEESKHIQQNYRGLKLRKFFNERQSP